MADLMEMVADQPEWFQRAGCQGTDAEAFFPERGGSTKYAERVCSRCEVRPECREYAFANDERFGVWGGLSEYDRRRIRHRQTAKGSA